MMFGLSSDLMPCPAALTMLLVGLRLKKIMLGVGLVTTFSLGLAITLVTLGVVAALGMRHAARLPGFSRALGVAPYVSSALVIGVGVFMGVSGFLHCRGAPDRHYCPTWRLRGGSRKIVGSEGLHGNHCFGQ